MLSGIWAAFKALGVILGLVERAQDRSIGAALQRGKDSEDELDRMDKAAQAGNNPAVSDAGELQRDTANRNRVKK